MLHANKRRRMPPRTKPSRYKPELLRAAVEDAMKRAGLTREGLSKRSDLGSSTIRKIVDGVTLAPRISTLVAAADTLGITVAELIGPEVNLGPVHPSPRDDTETDRRLELVQEQMLQIVGLMAQLRENRRGPRSQ